MWIICKYIGTCYYINMNTVILSKSEYEVLKSQASAYERLLKVVSKDVSVIPPTRSKSKIFSAFEKSGKYDKNFLSSFKKGLKRSSFFSEK